MTVSSYSELLRLEKHSRANNLETTRLMHLNVLLLLKFGKKESRFDTCMYPVEIKNGVKDCLMTDF